MANAVNLDRTEFQADRAVCKPSFGGTLAQLSRPTPVYLILFQGGGVHQTTTTFPESPSEPHSPPICRYLLTANMAETS